ncbi:MAG: sugar ABC transporter ATP-binding protein [bacterium]
MRHTVPPIYKKETYMENILECKDIVKSFGGVQALKKVAFSLRQGEVHALVGENGAGKSTLIKIISGALKLDRGEIFYLGKRVDISSPRVAQEIGISTVYQDPMVYPELSVLENIFLGREILDKRGNIDWKKEEERAKELFASLEISPSFLNEPIGKLTLGLQQLALIAKALVYESRVIIFDEPTAILTEHETERLFNIISRLKERNVSIIYISHRLEEIFTIADYVTVLRDGEVVGNFPISEITRDKIVELMAGRLLTEEIEHIEVKRENPILSVKNLTKKGRFYGISFDAYPGEILCFYGLVGSGRSDVAQALFGIQRYDSGEIIYQGNRLAISSPDEAMDLNIAYLPEDRKAQGLFLPLSVAYNISISILKNILKLFSFVDVEKEREVSQRYVSELSIKAPSIDTKVYSLSGGTQQKVVLAKWLAVNPKLLILDEPTHGIDVATKSEVHQIISKLARQGVSVIVISSEIPEVIKLADRVIVMHEGRITGVFKNREITQENLIRAATGERVSPGLD